MAMMLPGWLGEALNYAGFSWPLSNEDVLNQWAADFTTLGGDARHLADEIDHAINYVSSNNEGPAVDAFVSAMRSAESNLENLDGFCTGCELASGVCSVCAGIVVTLKVVFIVQLGILAASLASGPGALIVREAIRRAINAGINIAAEQVMNEAL